jgi:hypothetical protein
VLPQINPQMAKFPRAAVSGQMQQQQSSFRKQEAAEDSIMFARCLQMQPASNQTHKIIHSHMNLISSGSPWQQFQNKIQHICSNPTTSTCSDKNTPFPNPELFLQVVSSCLREISEETVAELLVAPTSA